MVATRLTHWLFQFCSRHEKFKNGTLEMDALPAYMQARADLGAILVVAQRLEIHANSGARQAVRVARAVPVEFDLRSGKASSSTHDISVGGLSALVGEAPVVGTLVPFRLNLGRDVQPIVGRCRVVANIPLRGSVRMAAAFEEIAKDGLNRIETLVFDAICSEIRVILRGEQPQDVSASSLPRGS
ncbi:MAG TPA: PilZ domain-containing protein [Polyangia bacterium]|jgi:PilZ domain.|nr:PilZ domain-containing protein [Polyangia bacterium]